MIQRVQSIFLAIVAICMFGILFFPIWQKVGVNVSDQEVVLNAWDMAHLESGKLIKSTKTFYITILAVISAALALGSMLSFKNRMQQVKLNFFNTVAIIAIMGLNVYFIFEGTTYFEVKENQGSFGIGFYLPLVALFFNFLANRFIRKDEQLVRSTDRLR